MSPRPDRYLAALPVAAVGGLTLAATQLHGLLEVVLPLVPLLLLVVSLLAGVYPGCETIVRLAERARSRRRAAGAESAPRPPVPPSRAIGGGLLIAFGIAQRPPPLTA